VSRPPLASPPVARPVVPVAMPLAADRACPPPAFLAQVWTILRNDLALECRRREQLGTMALFALLVLVALTFALDLAAERARAVAPGALWAAYVFAGTLGLGRGAALEREWGTLEGLLLAPVDRGAVYLAKALGNWLLVLAVQAASLPVAAVLFDLPLLRPALAPVLALGALGFSAVGTLFAAMAANTGAREVLLPVLLFPVSVPVVIASVRATAGVLDGSGTGPWLPLLLAFDAIFVSVAFVVAGAVLDD
jgi:heme exporter protein B